jgi:hypothetical protein
MPTYLDTYPAYLLTLNKIINAVGVRPHRLALLVITPVSNYTIISLRESNKTGKVGDIESYFYPLRLSPPTVAGDGIYRVEKP